MCLLSGVVSSLRLLFGVVPVVGGVVGGIVGGVVGGVVGGGVGGVGGVVGGVVGGGVVPVSWLNTCDALTP